MIKPERNFRRTFLNEAFIRNTKSFYWTFPKLTFPLSSIVRVGSHCVVSWSLVPPWSYRSFTPICTYSILLYLIITHVRGTHIVVTLNIVSKVLHVPRVAHPDYPSYDRLRIMSKDELLSLFCETPSSWGDHQNTPWSGFAKGLRFLNMVMTFILHPLSHYNSITEPVLDFCYPS